MTKTSKDRLKYSLKNNFSVYQIYLNHPVKETKVIIKSTQKQSKNKNKKLKDKMYPTGAQATFFLEITVLKPQD